jgi:hypothetical protein
MTIRSKTYFAALSCAAALTLAGCGKPDHIELLGVHPGMTQDAVKTASPSGSSLYCRGDGDAAFEQVSGLPPSTTLTFCTWTNVDSAGARVRSQVSIGNFTSADQQFAFDNSDGTLKSFSVEIAGNAFDPIVKSLTEKLGSPNSTSGLPGIIGGIHWEARDGTLTATTDEQRPYLTLLMLQPSRAKRS